MGHEHGIKLEWVERPPFIHACTHSKGYCGLNSDSATMHCDSGIFFCEELTINNHDAVSTQAGKRGAVGARRAKASAAMRSTEWFINCDL